MLLSIALAQTEIPEIPTICLLSAIIESHHTNHHFPTERATRNNHNQLNNLLHNIIYIDILFSSILYLTNLIQDGALNAT